MVNNCNKERSHEKIQNFGHMYKFGIPYLSSTQIWTKIGFDNYSFVYPTYLSKRSGHLGIKVY